MDKELKDLLGRYIDTTGDIIDYIYDNMSTLGDHVNALLDIIGKIGAKENGKKEN